eukprot:207754-Pleurochrysis_carterae.AAC.1
MTRARSRRGSRGADRTRSREVSKLWRAQTRLRLKTTSLLGMDVSMRQTFKMNSLHARDRLIRACASLINKCYVLMQSKQARLCVARQKEAMRVQPYSRDQGRDSKGRGC